MGEDGTSKKLGFLLTSFAAGAVVFAICAVGIFVTSSQDGAGSPSLVKYLVFGAPAYLVFIYLMLYSGSRGRMPWST